MTSITLYQTVLPTVSSIVAQFSAFKIFYSNIFHTLLCHMSKHAIFKTLNFKHCKSVACRYFFKFLQHLAVRCFVAIGITFQTVALEFFRRIFLSYEPLFLPLSCRVKKLSSSSLSSISLSSWAGLLKHLGCFSIAWVLHQRACKKWRFSFKSGLAATSSSPPSCKKERFLFKVSSSILGERYI